MNRIFEKSSGGIVYRKQKGKIEILLLEWENAKREREFVIPKGHMENSETAKDTALREIAEETGLAVQDLEIIKFMSKINYSFIATYKEGCPVIEKDVYLFLVKYLGDREPVPQKEERFLGFRWFSIEELKHANIKPDIHGFVRKNIQYM
ncbi:MAG: NUDIX domain-containing protein [Candidatus Gracilibacteria bacterium]|nr:NUDIX domain-containing protein [Candidatus Gracilibacteria bacterium]